MGLRDCGSRPHRRKDSAAKTNTFTKKYDVGSGGCSPDWAGAVRALALDHFKMLRVETQFSRVNAQGEAGHQQKLTNLITQCPLPNLIIHHNEMDTIEVAIVTRLS